MTNHEQTDTSKSIQNSRTTDISGSVEQPLGVDEVIRAHDGKPISAFDAWGIALQKGNEGKVTAPDGSFIYRSQALRNAMDQDYETLAKQIEAGFTEGTLRFLEFASKMHRYSAGNQDLIYMQAPYATYVQSFSAWSRGGYLLKSRAEGCKPIYILQPKPYMKITQRNEAGQVVDVEKKAVFFTVAVVYDVTSINQEHKKVPDFWTPLQGNADMLTHRLIEVLNEDDIKVVEGYPDLQAMGASLKGTIMLRPDLQSVNRFLVLAHEVAHEYLHKDKERRELAKEIKECQAEVSAYMLASHFGIKSPLSADYIRMYGNNKDTLKEQLKITQPLVHTLIDKMEKEYDLYAEFEYDEQKTAHQDARRNTYQRKNKHSRRRG